MAPPFAVAYLVPLLPLQECSVMARLSGNSSLIDTKESALHPRGRQIFATSLAGMGAVDFTTT